MMKTIEINRSKGRGYIYYDGQQLVRVSIPFPSGLGLRSPEVVIATQQKGSYTLSRVRGQEASWAMEEDEFKMIVSLTEGNGLIVITK